MIRKVFTVRVLVFVAALALLLLIGGFVFHDPLLAWCRQTYRLLSDHQRISAFISSFGSGAPVIFMLAQILQVIFAPVPGEVTGFIGGFLFGALPGFVYSSIGLTVGSFINFFIGRFLGERYVRRMIPAPKLQRFDALLKRQGVLVVFILFVFPGFPKDYLCLFLGLSALPLKLFMLLAAIGRMPGTFMLSLQGAYLFEQNYLMLAGLMLLCVVLGLLTYRYRRDLYRWLERFNGQHSMKT